MRILFDKNVPVGVRHLLAGYAVQTFPETGWQPQLQNGELLAAGFDVLATSDQNIKYQQNLSVRTLALVVLGSNIWPIVRNHAEAIKAAIDAATLSSYAFIEMPLPAKPRSAG